MTSHPPKLSKFRLWTLTAPIKTRVRFSAAIFAIILTGFFSQQIFLSMTFTPLHLVLGIVVTVAIAVGIGFSYYWILMKTILYAQNRLHAAIGYELTTDDKVVLYLWYRGEAMPTSATLKPVLGRYLDYVITAANGRQFVVAPRLRQAILIIGALNIVIGTINLMLPDRTLGTIAFNYIIGLILLATYGPRQSKGRVNLVSALNYRRLKRYAAMQRELKG